MHVIVSFALFFSLRARLFCPVRSRGILLSLFCLSSAAMAGELPDFAKLVERYSPAVVKIQVTSQAGMSSAAELTPDPSIPEPFRRYFQTPQQRGEPPQMGLGSGFIIDSDGYILTNHHVIDGARKITVQFNDRREFDAEVVGSDEATDLALLKIHAKNLPALRLADKGDVKVGQWVLAIGSPFGLDYSVTQGIVSAKGRSLPNEKGNVVPFIQTDVAINPGNSGGPLFDLEGNVVGINAQIYTRSGGSMGLSFAIPASVAGNVVAQLKKHGFVKRGWLGVMIQEVDKNLAQSFGLKKPEGALIAQVLESSPAQEAGIMQGDIVTAVNDEAILYSADLPHSITQIEPGTKVTLRIVREGKPLSLPLRVGELQDGRAPRVSQQQQIPHNFLGLVLGDIDQQQRLRFQISVGVLVRAVEPNSPAAQTGIQPGDIITQLGARAVNSVADFNKQAAHLPKNSLQPIGFIQRNGRRVFRSIVIP